MTVITCHVITNNHVIWFCSGIESGEGENDEDMVIDVVGVADTPSCPYNESKIKTVMNECSQNMNLVRLSLENADSELERSYNFIHPFIQPVIHSSIHLFVYVTR